MPNFQWYTHEMIKRNLAPFIARDLRKKMILLAGPRQVGKTTLAMEIIKKPGGHYYNWDLSEDRETILTKGFLNDGLVVLDELHKYDRWKNFLKGIYDKYHQTLQMIVTGSARLDIYRRGGDSLFGRHYLYHLHPLTMGELTRHEILKPEEFLAAIPSPPDSETYTSLLKWGGFPDPFFAANEESHARWSLQRKELLVQEDIRDLTQINLLSLVEHLLLLLPKRVGSILSVNSLKEDLQVAHNTITSWLKTFERLYITYTLDPHTAKLQRAIHKEKKLYLWDWSQIPDESARFENMVASHLWKAVQTWRDLGMGDFELKFLRDRDRREVDFCILKNHKPWILVEAKLSETQAAEPLLYFANRLKVPAFQLTDKKNVERKTAGVFVLSAERFLPLLP